ncbi:MAG: ABC transporter permease [Vicinamibacterales bacterium]
MTSLDRGFGRAPARRAAVPVHRYWYPLAALVRRDVQKRYATTMLGIGWTILQPFVLVVIYVVVFAFILRSGRDTQSAREFVFFMLVGMLPYLAIAEGLQRASTALREDRALLDRAEFPAEVIPAARVVSASVAEAVGLVLLLVLGALFDIALSGWILVVPVLIALRLLITCGLAWVVSTLAIFVTDLAEVLSLLLTAWLFLTPIFYTADAVPDALKWMLVLNPLHHLVEAYRRVLLEGRAPLPEGLFVFAWAAVLAGAGLWFFRKTLDRGKDLL